MQSAPIPLLHHTHTHLHTYNTRKTHACTSISAPHTVSGARASLEWRHHGRLCHAHAAPAEPHRPQRSAGAPRGASLRWCLHAGAVAARCSRRHDARAEPAMEGAQQATRGPLTGSRRTPPIHVQVISVDAARGCMLLGGADIVDGSPILDIKPFVPFCDAPDARAPAWVQVCAPQGRARSLVLLVQSMLGCRTCSRPATCTCTSCQVNNGLNHRLGQRAPQPSWGILSVSRSTSWHEVQVHMGAPAASDWVVPGSPSPGLTSALSGGPNPGGGGG